MQLLWLYHFWAYYGAGKTYHCLPQGLGGLGNPPQYMVRSDYSNCFAAIPLLLKGERGGLFRQGYRNAPVWKNTASKPSQKHEQHTALSNLKQVELTKASANGTVIFITYLLPKTKQTWRPARSKPARTELKRPWDIIWILCIWYGTSWAYHLILFCCP